MPLQTTTTVDTSTVQMVITEFLNGAVTALPRILSGLVFLTLTYFVIRLIRSMLRSVLTLIYLEEQRLIVDLLVAAVNVFLRFGAGLALLKIVGMDDIAANLGTATGFIGLGAAFALKEMIADTVVGVYLLRDSDFNEGDFVNTASVTGTIVRNGAHSRS